MWALGVIVYLLLCGFPPFFDNNIKNMFYQIKQGKFHFPSPFWDAISDSAKDLITKLLCINPKKRYTASQVMKHDWITGEFVNVGSIGTEDEDDDDGCGVPPLAQAVTLKAHQHAQKSISTTDTQKRLDHRTSNRTVVIHSHMNEFNSEDSSVIAGILGEPSNSLLDQSPHDSNVTDFSLVTLENAVDVELDVDDEDSKTGVETRSRHPIEIGYSSNPVPQMFNRRSASVTLIDAVSPPIDDNILDSKKVFSLENTVEFDRRQQKEEYMKHRRFRGNTNVAYMVDGTIFQMQKQQLNKHKIELQKERASLDRLVQQLQKDRELFEQKKVLWNEIKKKFEEEHSHLKRLKLELNDVVNKYLSMAKI